MKCANCEFSEGTEATNWLWCTKFGKKVHKDGGCAVGKEKNEERLYPSHQQNPDR